ncbi:MAG: hypothetical protein LBK29_00315 [Oscillospiraceae bacterium]|jgi:hypothetical protein|nr:hypothetical protein [Oscillospiraceae bacterium]
MNKINNKKKIGKTMASMITGFAICLTSVYADETMVPSNTDKKGLSDIPKRTTLKSSLLGLTLATVGFFLYNRFDSTKNNSRKRRLPLLPPDDITFLHESPQHQEVLGMEDVSASAESIRSISRSENFTEDVPSLEESEEEEQIFVQEPYEDVTDDLPQDATDSLPPEEEQEFPKDATEGSLFVEEIERKKWSEFYDEIEKVKRCTFGFEGVEPEIILNVLRKNLPEKEICELSLKTEKTGLEDCLRNALEKTRRIMIQKEMDNLEKRTHDIDELERRLNYFKEKIFDIYKMCTCIFSNFSIESKIEPEKFSSVLSGCYSELGTLHQAEIESENTEEKLEKFLSSLHRYQLEFNTGLDSFTEILRNDQEYGANLKKEFEEELLFLFNIYEKEYHAVLDENFSLKFKCERLESGVTFYWDYFCVDEKLKKLEHLGSLMLARVREEIEWHKKSFREKIQLFVVEQLGLRISDDACDKILNRFPPGELVGLSRVDFETITESSICEFIVSEKLQSYIIKESHFKELKNLSERVLAKLFENRNKKLMELRHMNFESVFKHSICHVLSLEEKILLAFNISNTKMPKNESIIANNLPRNLIIILEPLNFVDYIPHLPEIIWHSNTLQEKILLLGCPNVKTPEDASILVENLPEYKMNHLSHLEKESFLKAENHCYMEWVNTPLENKFKMAIRCYRMLGKGGLKSLAESLNEKQRKEFMLTYFVESFKRKWDKLFAEKSLEEKLILVAKILDGTLEFTGMHKATIPNGGDPSHQASVIFQNTPEDELLVLNGLNFESLLFEFPSALRKSCEHIEKFGSIGRTDVRIRIPGAKNDMLRAILGSVSSEISDDILAKPLLYAMSCDQLKRFVLENEKTNVNSFFAKLFSILYENVYDILLHSLNQIIIEYGGAEVIANSFAERMRNLQNVDFLLQTLRSYLRSKNFDDVVTEFIIKVFEGLEIKNIGIKFLKSILIEDGKEARIQYFVKSVLEHPRGIIDILSGKNDPSYLFERLVKDAGGIDFIAKQANCAMLSIGMGVRNFWLKPELVQGMLEKWSEEVKLKDTVSAVLGPETKITDHFSKFLNFLGGKDKCACFVSNWVKDMGSTEIENLWFAFAKKEGINFKKLAGSWDEMINSRYKEKRYIIDAIISVIFDFKNCGFFLKKVTRSSIYNALNVIPLALLRVILHYLKDFDFSIFTREGKMAKLLEYFSDSVNVAGILSKFEDPEFIQAQINEGGGAGNIASKLDSSLKDEFPRDFQVFVNETKSTFGFLEVVIPERLRFIVDYVKDPKYLFGWFAEIFEREVKVSLEEMPKFLREILSEIISDSRSWAGNLVGNLKNKNADEVAHWLESMGVVQDLCSEIQKACILATGVEDEFKVNVVETIKRMRPMFLYNVFGEEVASGVFVKNSKRFDEKGREIGPLVCIRIVNNSTLALKVVQDQVTKFGLPLGQFEIFVNPDIPKSSPIVLSLRSMFGGSFVEYRI